MPVELLKRIDDKWKASDEFTGRTHFIEKACEYYLDCEKCPVCGNFNHKLSVVCSMCESKLGAFQQSLDYLNELLLTCDRMINQIYDLVRSYDDLFGKINWLLDKLNDEKKSSVVNIIEDMFIITDRGIFKGRFFIKCHEIYSKYTNLPIIEPPVLIEKCYIELFGENSTNPHTVLSPSLLNECLYINYHYRVCQLLAQYPISRPLKEIDDALDGLNNYKSSLTSLLNDVTTAYETLEGIEKMTNVLL